MFLHAVIMENQLSFLWESALNLAADLLKLIWHLLHAQFRFLLLFLLKIWVWCVMMKTFSDQICYEFDVYSVLGYPYLSPNSRKFLPLFHWIGLHIHHLFSCLEELLLVFLWGNHYIPSLLLRFLHLFLGIYVHCWFSPVLYFIWNIPLWLCGVSIPSVDMKSHMLSRTMQLPPGLKCGTSVQMTCGVWQVTSVSAGARVWSGHLAWSQTTAPLYQSEPTLQVEPLVPRHLTHAGTSTAHRISTLSSLSTEIRVSESRHSNCPRSQPNQSTVIDILQSQVVGLS